MGHMRVFPRLAITGCAAALLVLPLAAAGWGSAGASTTTAQVAASNWSVMPNTQAPPTTGHGAYASSVSCVTSTFCMGTGSGLLFGGGYYAELWNGTTWSPVSLPSTGSGSPILGQVSCVSTSFCIAVGGADTASPGVAPLILQWNGTAWITVTGAPTSGAALLTGVSCASTTFCVAAGLAETSDVAQPFAEQWNGTTWSMAALPEPASGLQSEPLNVSCGSTSACMVIGISAPTGGGTEQPWSAYWNGTSWTSPVVPPDPGGATVMSSVSCVGNGFCTAVGYFTPSGSSGTPAYQNIIDTWNGASWTAATAASTSSSSNILAGVSCFSATSCTAVGASLSGSSSSGPQIQTWNGAAWSAQSVPSNPGSAEDLLLAVDCLTDWSCVAVGAAGVTSGSVPHAYELEASIARSGYRFVAADGGIFSYGSGAPFLGSMGGQKLNTPIVGMAVMPAGDGYYLVASDGGIFSYGSAQFFGSMGGKPLNKPIVGMAVTADGGGYWLVASDGGIFAFGDAQFFGSMGGKPLNKPIVGMAATPNGTGYYEVASDGGIFSFGSAPFQGSAGSLVLNKPVVGMSVPSSGGYYLVATDGGIFSYPPSLPFYGSAGSLVLNKPVVGMSAVAGGYYLVAADGGIFSYPPSLPFLGSMGGKPLNAPIVGMTS